MKEFTDIRKFIESKKRLSPGYKVWDLETILPRLPIKVGEDVWQGIIFKEDIQIEFGNQRNPSSSWLVCLNEVAKVHSSRVTLIGPDIGEIEKKESPLGMLAIVGGIKIESDHLQQLNSVLAIANSIEGFLLRSLPRKKWFRLSKNVYEKGISFEHIGQAFITLFKKKYPDLVESVEIVFITQDSDSVLELQEYEKSISKIFRTALQGKIIEYIKKYEKLRGDCDLDEECEICDYKPVCEGINEMIETRNRTKEEQKQLKEL